MRDKTTVSLVLSRKRPFTLEMIRTLSRFLGIPSDILIRPMIWLDSKHAVGKIILDIV